MEKPLPGSEINDGNSDMKNESQENPFCYLCGKDIENPEIDGDDDHVPPKSFIPSAIRKAHFGNHDSRYMILHAHKKCNNGWSDIANTTLLKFGLMATDPEHNLNGEVRREMEKHLSRTFPHGGSTRAKARRCLNDFYSIVAANGFKTKPIFKFTQNDIQVFLNIGKAIYTYEVGKYLEGRISLEYKSNIHPNPKCMGFRLTDKWEDNIKGNKQIQGNKDWFGYQIIHTDTQGFITYTLWSSFLFQVAFKDLQKSKS